MGERFHCPRCGYARQLKCNEDAFRLYVLHEQRCDPVVGGQVWLPFITEDNVALSPADDKRPLFTGSRDPLQLDQGHEKWIDGAADQNLRKAA
jgi:hypothetical protein